MYLIEDWDFTQALRNQTAITWYEIRSGFTLFNIVFTEQILMALLKSMII